MPSIEAMLLKYKPEMGRTCFQNGGPSFSKDCPEWRTVHWPQREKRQGNATKTASKRPSPHIMLTTNTGCCSCCCWLVPSIAMLRCFAVLDGAVQNNSTVSVVGFEGQSKRWWVS